MKIPEVGDFVWFYREGIAANEQPDRSTIVSVWDNQTVNVMVAPIHGFYRAELGVPIWENSAGMPCERHVEYPKQHLVMQCETYLFGDIGKEES